MVGALTKAGIEAELARTISRFHADQHGCAPERTVAYVVGDMVVIRHSGCFTPTERQLAETEDGRKLVKSARRELRSLMRRQAEKLVGDNLGVKAVRSYWDLDVRIGETVETYVLAEDLTERFTLA